LFQLLSGLFLPDSGRIEVMGHDMSRDAVPALAGLGIVFQQPTLDLELPLSPTSCSMRGCMACRALAKARIDRELVRLDLKDRATDKVANSAAATGARGTRPRADARTAHLLMDEATVGLDPASRSELLKLLWRCGRSAR
jgi:ABC-2 type transport system ATP-binding protein